MVIHTFLFFLRAKKLTSARYDFPPRRTGFPPLRLPYFAACPAELRGAILFSFIFSQRRRDAKKLWCARFDFPPRRTGFPPLRLPYFAACPAELRGAILFSFIFSQRPTAAGRTQRRKEIVLRSVSLSAAADSLRLPYFASYSFFFYILAKPQRNCGPPLGSCF
jgi:hypothetical protein